jgi:hypothetical protein
MPPSNWQVLQRKVAKLGFAYQLPGFKRRRKVRPRQRGAPTLVKHCLLDASSQPENGREKLPQA